MLITRTYVLTGPNKGKTLTLKNYRFVEGKLTIEADVSAHKSLERFLFRNWQVVPAEANPEQHRAVAKPSAAQRIADVENRLADLLGRPVTIEQAVDLLVAQENHAHQNDPDPAAQAPAGPSVSHAGEAAGAAANGDRQSAGPDHDADDSSPEEHGARRGDELLKLERIAAALGALDHGSDDHWTKDGSPRVSAVAKLLDGEAVTSAEIHRALPGFTRQAVAVSETR